MQQWRMGGSVRDSTRDSERAHRLWSGVCARASSASLIPRSIKAGWIVGDEG